MKNGRITKICGAQHNIPGYFRWEKYCNKFFNYCSDIGICKEYICGKNDYIYTDIFIMGIILEINCVNIMLNLKP